MTTRTQPAAIRSLASLRTRVGEWRRAGERVAFVPTMGALHAGHISLVRLAAKRADRVVVSIFVNPTQFAPGEDFEAYPRDLKADRRLLAGLGVDIVYTPTDQHMYHPDHSTALRVGGVGDGLETDHRPTFFHGVALVVAKLLNRVQPDIAVFGEKDYQQLAVIRRMVRDLDMPVRIIGAPIARDDHGLALSSRNRYFSEGGLEVARALNRIMFGTRDALQSGAAVERTLRESEAALVRAGLASVDYVSLTDANSLQPVTRGPIRAPARLLVAAHAPARPGQSGSPRVRLIDNCAVDPT